MQLHGPRPGAEAVRAALGGRASEVLIIQAVPVPDSGADPEGLFASVAATRQGADLLLFDTRSAGRFGGTGTPFPWHLAREAAGDIPFLVAGGIGPSNAAEALAASGAIGVDVSSGVESSPGVKDPDLLRALFATIGRNDDLDHTAPFRPVRGPLRPGDARVRPGGTGRGLREVPRRPGLPGRTAHRCRPTTPAGPRPLFLADRLSERAGCRVYLKREDLAHTGAHKINNTLGQILLATRMGKKRIIAETGAGQHGVATATVAALFGLECHVYMGEEDIRRQELNVFRMRLLGAEVLPGDLRQRHSQGRHQRGHPRLGGQRGDHPLHHRLGGRARARIPPWCATSRPVIGRETREQILEKEGRLPDGIVACVGAGSNAIGMFHEFVDEPGVRHGGRGGGRAGPRLRQARRLAGPGHRRASSTAPISYVLQDEDGQIQEAHSIAAGLDYPSVGPEHAFLKDSGRVEYTSATDEEALAAFQTLSRLEGIIPALESAHAIAYLLRRRPRLRAGGRGGGQPLRPGRQGRVQRGRHPGGEVDERGARAA